MYYGALLRIDNVGKRLINFVVTDLYKVAQNIKIYNLLNL